MKQLTEENTRRAIEKAQKNKCTVKAVAPDAYIAHCSKGHDHFVVIGFFGDELYADCYECPSNLGRHICYHMVSAAALHIARENMRKRAAASRRQVPGGVLLGNRAQGVEKVRGIHI